MKKDFFYYFGGRKNFNFYLLFIIGFVLVFYDKINGEQYFLIMLGNLGLNSYFNVKNKEVISQSPNPSIDGAESQ